MLDVFLCSEGGQEKAWQVEVVVICAHVAVESFQEATLPTHQLFSLCFRMTLKRQGKCLNFSFTKGPAREIAFPFRPSRPAPTQFTVDKVGHLSFSDPTPQLPLLLHSALRFLCILSSSSLICLCVTFCLIFLLTLTPERTVLITWGPHKVGRRKIVPFWLGRWVKPYGRR